LYGWELGIVEAVGISILLGACVDYPAHVVERFVELDTESSTRGEEGGGGGGMEIIVGRGGGGGSGGIGSSNQQSDHTKRSERVRSAMTSVGVSVLNASLTTVCSCGVLTFCTVQVFNRVGLIMLTASAVSMIATLFFIPAALALCGPKKFIRSWRYRMKVFIVVSLIGMGSFLIVYLVNVSLGRPLF